MGESCCESKSTELNALKLKQKSVLQWVLVLNALMFVLEFSFGMISHSSALLADSLDMLGDSMVYAFSLYVLNKNSRWIAGASLLKGTFMALFGVLVLGQAMYRLWAGTLPESGTMGLVGALALAVNMICLILLYKHRSDDINMSSTWLCSRNDIIANVGVIGASVLVGATQSIWPDTIVAMAIAGLFLKSSMQVIGAAKIEYSAAT